jgi:acetylornithine deacetylase/succinyl-diaminopimelate desuccinylase-like protein
MDGIATSDRRHWLLDLTRELMLLKMTTPERCSVGMELIQAVLNGWGFESRIRTFPGGVAPGKRALEAVVGPENARYTVCLHGHLDVVGVDDPELEWLWTPTVTGDWLEGRGGLDMLGAIACKLLVLYLIASKLKDVRVILLLVDDEEQEPPHIIEDWWAAEGDRVDLVISGEPTRLKIGNVTRSIVRARFEITGVGGHSGYGFKYQNPIPWAFRLHELISGLKFTPRASRDYPTGAEVQPTLFSAGSHRTETSIPQRGTLVWNFRLIPGQDSAAALAAVDEVVQIVSREMIADAVDRHVEGAETERPIEWSHSYPIPPGRIARNDPFVRTLVKAARPAHPAGTELLIAQGGAGDGGFTRRGNGSRAVECGLTGEGYHGVERLYLPSQLSYTEMLLRFFDLLGQRR